MFLVDLFEVIVAAILGVFAGVWLYHRLTCQNCRQFPRWTKRLNIYGGMRGEVIAYQRWCIPCVRTQLGKQIPLGQSFEADLRPEPWKR